MSDPSPEFDAEFPPLTVGDLVDHLAKMPRDAELWTWDAYWDEPDRYRGLPELNDIDERNETRTVWL